MKEKTYTSFMLEMELPEPWFIRGKTEDEILSMYFQEYLRIEEQIKRHVDNIGYMTFEPHIEYYCSYCQRDWEEDEDGCPTCCNEAVTEWEKLNE